eukprot:scaffold135512_cov15-Prasinocladus_malaysianus.AAC.2
MPKLPANKLTFPLSYSNVLHVILDVSIASSPLSFFGRKRSNNENLHQHTLTGSGSDLSPDRRLLTLPNGQ